jgi:GNAT superfamily N-acetyltransferase
MNLNPEQIAELEHHNYAAIIPTAEVTPGMEVVLRDDVILNSSTVFPTPDLNHACLLRATPGTVSALLDEVTAYFADREVPVTLFVSPACTPEDLTARLTARGFVKQREEEAWMVLEHASDFALAAPARDVIVEQIGPEDAPTFARVFLRAFDMPEDYAPYMAQLLAPSIGLPGVFHYLAHIDDKPAGICTLLCYQDLAIVGSAGVLPIRRGRRVLASLAFTVHAQAQRQGIDRALLQTTAGTMFERFLRISGFKRAFTRACYTRS